MGLATLVPLASPEFVHSGLRAKVSSIWHHDVPGLEILSVCHGGPSCILLGAADSDEIQLQWR